MNEEETPEPTTLIGLLDQLAEPPEPPPVPMVPQTFGWVVLAVLALMLLAWFGWHMWRRWKSDAYRRAALAELSGVGDDPLPIANILRRTALAVWPRERVAGLTGPDWLAFLDTSGGGESFTSGPGRALADAQYRTGHTPVPGLGEAAKRWVRKHQVGSGT